MELTGNVQGMIDLLGGGSDVEVEQILESGTKIAVITVDDVPTDIYAPEGAEVSVTPIQESGTKIATINVDDVPTDIYAPEVSVTPIQESGTKIATISVDDVPTDIYAPEEVYSSDETVTIETWFDKPVYTKTISFTIGNTSGWIGVPHNIVNLDKIIEIRGLVEHTGSYYTVGTNPVAAISFSAGPTNVSIYLSSTYFSGKSVTITLKYTKSS